MDHTPSLSESPTNSSYPLHGTIRHVSDEEDDDPVGSGNHNPYTHDPQVTTVAGNIELSQPPHIPGSNLYTLLKTAPHSGGDLNTDVSSVFIDIREPQGAIQAAESLRSKRTRMANWRTLFVSSRPIGPSPGYLVSLKSAITYTPLNVCLAFIPVSWALHYSHQSDTLTFICSALAIIPLAAELTLATEQIALRTSQAVGGLVNATFGNIVEMIIGGIALSRVRHSLCFCLCANTHFPVRSRSSAELVTGRTHQ